MKKNNGNRMCYHYGISITIAPVDVTVITIAQNKNHLITWYRRSKSNSDLYNFFCSLSRCGWNGGGRVGGGGPLESHAHGIVSVPGSVQGTEPAPCK